MEWDYLKGDGDFRSDEVKKLRDEADIIVTNPPFSLFREFLAWLVEGKKKFLIIGNMNALKYKEVFPLIQANKIWVENPFVRGAANGTFPHGGLQNDGGNYTINRQPQRAQTAKKCTFPWSSDEVYQKNRKWWIAEVNAPDLV